MNGMQEKIIGIKIIRLFKKKLKCNFGYIFLCAMSDQEQDNYYMQMMNLDEIDYYGWLDEIPHGEVKKWFGDEEDTYEVVIMFDLDTKFPQGKEAINITIEGSYCPKKTVFKKGICQVKDLDNIKLKNFKQHIEYRTSSLFAAKLYDFISRYEEDKEEFEEEDS